MILLITFAFLAGIVTILSPCILPVLPIILSSSVDASGKRRPLGVVIGFIASFTFFTLFLSTIVKVSGIPADTLRILSVIVLASFGFSLLLPQFQFLVERLFSKVTRFMPSGQKRTGFHGGLLIGLSLGLLWTPCVGPILASVISLAITGTVSAQAILITFAYSVGTAIPMFLIMYSGNTALRKVPWLLRYSPIIQRVFGVLMVITAVGIAYNVDRTFQTYFLDRFPQYGANLIRFEDNETVRRELEKTGGKQPDETIIGKSMLDVNSPKKIKAPEIIPGGEWFNSPPLTIAQLRGKVVVIDFWTYSCINCQRTFPYLRDWWAKYKDRGLVIIGVHSPEFEFEKDKDNVSQAISDFGLTYPIVQDNDFATWLAYNNRFWPAKYFVDKDGFIRYTHFGEGAYDESERVIRQLLAESGSVLPNTNVANPQYQIYSRTPETYLGHLRIHNFSSPEGIRKDIKAEYSFPAQIGRNTFAYDGTWAITTEFSAPQSGSKLLLNFEAKEVYLVARPKNGSARFRVYIDDKIGFAGEDNVNGVVTVTTDSLYKLINLPESGRHILRLEFADDNLEIYAFTFG